MEKVTKLCAWCGEKPVRSSKSKYCSWECVEKKYAAAAANDQTKSVQPVAVLTPDPVTPPVVSDDRPLCEWCGEHPVREYKNGRLSKYCSKECSSKAISAQSKAWCEKNKAMLSAVARRENARRKNVRDANSLSRNAYFPATTPQQDWRDANFNPLG